MAKNPRLSLPGSGYTLEFDERTGVMYITGTNSEAHGGLYFDHASGNEWDLEKLYNFGEALKRYALMNLRNQDA